MTQDNKRDSIEELVAQLKTVRLLDLRMYRTLKQSRFTVSIAGLKTW